LDASGNRSARKVNYKANATSLIKRALTDDKGNAITPEELMEAILSADVEGWKDFVKNYRV
jgi:hypothetical protein